MQKSYGTSSCLTHPSAGNYFFIKSVFVRFLAGAIDRGWIATRNFSIRYVRPVAARLPAWPSNLSRSRKHLCSWVLLVYGSILSMSGPETGNYDRRCAVILSRICVGILGIWPDPFEARICIHAHRVLAYCFCALASTKHTRITSPRKQWSIMFLLLLTREIRSTKTTRTR